MQAANSFHLLFIFIAPIALYLKIFVNDVTIEKLKNHYLCDISDYHSLMVDKNNGAYATTNTYKLRDYYPYPLHFSSTYTVMTTKLNLKHM